MGVLQSGRFGVVEVGEGARLQLGIGRPRRVEPVVAQFVQLLRRVADRNHARGVNPFALKGENIHLLRPVTMFRGETLESEYP